MFEEYIYNNFNTHYLKSIYYSSSKDSMFFICVDNSAPEYWDNDPCIVPFRMKSYSEEFKYDIIATITVNQESRLKELWLESFPAIEEFKKIEF